MDVKENTEKVYPTRAELEQEVQTNVPCPIVGCQKIFRQTSALRFHLVKLHRLIQSESDARLAQVKCDKAKQCEYYCPEDGCPYSANKEKFFRTLKKLKQHYLRLHAQRKFPCLICGEEFGLVYDLTHHVGRCHKKPRCLTCGIWMEGRDLLADHCRETGHQGAGDDDPNGTSTARSSILSDQQTSISGNVMGISKSDEHIEHLKASDVSSDVPKETVNSEVKTNPHVDNEPLERVEQLQTKKSSSKPKKKRISSQNENNLRKSKRVTSVEKPRNILPVPNFLVIPSVCFAKTDESAVANTMLVFGVNVAMNQDSTMRNLLPKPTVFEVGDLGAGFAFAPQDDVLSVAGNPQANAWATLPHHDPWLAEASKQTLSVSTQTVYSRNRKKRAAETQTTGEYVLRNMIGVQGSQLSRQSCGSQVSPRAQVKQSVSNVQSIQTQTSKTPRKQRKIGSGVTAGSSSNRMETVVCPVLNSSNDSWPDLMNSETQTMELFQQLQESLVAENSSTQTLESYLFDNFPSNSCTSSYNCVNSLVEDDSVYQTMVDEQDNFLNSVVTPLTEEQEQTMKCNDALSMNKPNFAMLSSEIENTFDRDQNEETCKDYLLNGDLFMENNFCRYASASSVTSSDSLLAEQKTFSTETQTVLSDSLADFLTTSSQTNNFDDTMSIHTETQTAEDDFFQQLLSHMETQTNDEFLTEFGFTDIETQTTWMFGEENDPIMEPYMSGNSTPPSQRTAASTDMETQTCF